MAMLEKRFYPRQEIAEIVGITNLKDGHFAEKVRRYLDKRGYEYEYSSRGANITRLPQTAEEQLAFLNLNYLLEECHVGYGLPLVHIGALHIPPLFKVGDVAGICLTEIREGILRPVEIGLDKCIDGRIVLFFGGSTA